MRHMLGWSLRRLALAASLLALAGCRGQLGEPCEDPGECARGLSCWDADVFWTYIADGGQCSESCSEDSECGGEGICVDGLCARACNGEGDPVCGEGTTCLGQWCVLSCAVDSDCRSDAHCPTAGGVCEPLSG